MDWIAASLPRHVDAVEKTQLDKTESSVIHSFTETITTKRNPHNASQNIQIQEQQQKRQAQTKTEHCPNCICHFRGAADYYYAAFTGFQILK
jgi:hypothetical protein